MNKFRINRINIEKEEEIINNKLKDGYVLDKVKYFKYIFKKTDEPMKNGIGTIRIDYRGHKTHENYEEYIALFEDSGWEFVSAVKPYYYFKKVREDAGDELFNKDDRAEMCMKMLKAWIWVVCMEFLCLVTVPITESCSLDRMLHPKQLYYTPGLWDLKGLRFVAAFLFETPFVIFRDYTVLIYITLLIIGLVKVYGTYKTYKKYAR